jgi:hypothetical protein
MDKIFFLFWYLELVLKIYLQLSYTLYIVYVINKGVTERFIIIIIIIIIDLQPFVGPWPLFQFVSPIHSR